MSAFPVPEPSRASSYEVTKDINPEVNVTKQDRLLLNDILGSMADEISMINNNLDELERISVIYFTTTPTELDDLKGAMDEPYDNIKGSPLLNILYHRVQTIQTINRRLQLIINSIQQ
jgi:hypothetical protein